MKRRLIKLGVVAGLLAGAVSMTPNSLQAWTRCGLYDGKACASSSSSFVCYNAYPYEPGRCDCFNNVWSCG